MPKSRKTSSNREKTSSSLVLIGCNSFIGRNALKRLETDSRYKKVVAIDIAKPPITLKKTKFYKLDLTAAMADVALVEILKEERCDTLLHFGNPISPMRNESFAHELIAIGTFYIVNACHSAGVRKIVLTSTADVYGAHPENPNYLTEEMTPRGSQQNKFLGDKLDAERQVLKYQKKHPESVVTILRCATMLGPTITSFKTRYLKRPAVLTMLGFDPLLQCVHEDDVIGAVMKAVHEDHKGIFNIAADGVLPLSRVIEIMGGVNVPVTQTVFKLLVQLLWFGDISPAPSSYADFLRYLCVVDNSKLKKELGFIPKYTTKEALLSFVEAQRVKNIELVPEGVE